MKKITFVYLSIFFVLASCSKKTEIENTKSGKSQTDNNNKEEEWLPPLKVATYNIEYDTGGDNPWSNRKELVKNMFDKYSPDIIGIQEPSKKQLDDMQALMPQYSHLGTDVRGETMVNNRLSVTIFYKKDHVEIEKWGTFWLSETPTTASKGWDADQYRICTWAKAKDKSTQKEFYFFSTHLDQIGTAARTNGVQLLLDTIPVISAGYPAILVGDFNAAQTTSYYKLMVSGKNIKDTYDLTTNKTNAQRGTYNYYDIEQANKNTIRIDHIFITPMPTVKVNSWAIRTDIFNGKYPSDHFPVIAEINFSKTNK